MVKQVTEKDFEQEVLHAATPVLVDFHATWCGPCRMQGPLLDEFAAEHDGELLVVKVDIDESGQLAYKYRITGVPTLVVFSEGREVQRSSGLHDPEALELLVQKVQA